MFEDEMSVKPKTQLVRPNRAAMIACLKETAARLRRRPTRREFRRASGLSTRAIEQAFGTYRKLLLVCGYEIHGSPRRLDDEVLLKGMRDALQEANGVVVREQFARFSRHDPRTLIKRWGGWNNALAALRDWLERKEPAFVHLAALRQHCRGVKAPGPALSGTRCGDLLRFRALDHAPMTESAVIFLFGLVAEELGFILDAVGMPFPDAVGRRRMADGWRHVRIEFEYRSRNFREHGHDPKGCDLIVCWEDNWPESPLEVLELRREIATLPARDTDFAALHSDGDLSKRPAVYRKKSRLAAGERRRIGA